MTIDWDHLRIVEAIQGAGSLHGAAQALALDRATVVRRLDALEHALGARLFERRREGCTLTAAGAEIIGTVGGIAEAVADLSRRVAHRDRTTQAAVTVALPDFVAAELLVPELWRLREVHPGLAVEFVTSYSMANLARGEADIALRNRPPDHNTLVVRRLGSAGFAYFASSDYLSRRGVPEPGLEGHDVVLLAEAAMRLPMFAAATPWAEGARVVLRTGDIASSAAAAVAGVGIALLPCTVAARRAELMAVAPGIVATTDHYLVTHRDLRRQARIRAVLDFVVDVLNRHRSAIAGSDLTVATDRSQLTSLMPASMSANTIAGVSVTSASKASKSGSETAATCSAASIATKA